MIWNFRVDFNHFGLKVALKNLLILVTIRLIGAKSMKIVYKKDM